MKKKLLQVFFLLLTIFFVYPIFFVFIGTIMGGNEIREYLLPLMTNKSSFATWSFLPNEPTLKFYVELMLDTPEFFVMFWNSVKVTIGIILGQLIVSIPAAWALAMYEFKGRKLIYYIYVIIAIIPFVILMLPQYLILKQMKILDTLYGIILPGMFSTFPTIIINGFFKKIPKTLIETARSEGANEAYILTRIGIPLAKGGIYLSIIYIFIEQWELFEQPLLFIETKSHWTLSLFLTNITLDYANLAFVSAFFAMIPPLLILGIGKEVLKSDLAKNSLKE